MACNCCLYKAFCSDADKKNNNCVKFENQSLYIKKPCKIGDRLYIILNYGKIVEYNVYDISYEFEKDIFTFFVYNENGYNHYYSNQLNELIFFSKEKAIEHMKEIYKEDE